MNVHPPMAWRVKKCNSHFWARHSPVAHHGMLSCIESLMFVIPSQDAYKLGWPLSLPLVIEEYCGANHHMMCRHHLTCLELIKCRRPWPQELRGHSVTAIHQEGMWRILQGLSILTLPSSPKSPQNLCTPEGSLFRERERERVGSPCAQHPRPCEEPKSLQKDTERFGSSAAPNPWNQVGRDPHRIAAYSETCCPPGAIGTTYFRMVPPPPGSMGFGWQGFQSYLSLPDLSAHAQVLRKDLANPIESGG